MCVKIDRERESHDEMIPKCRASLLLLLLFPVFVFWNLLHVQYVLDDDEDVNNNKEEVERECVRGERAL